MKIAIIGSGISGLTAAYQLHRQHDVHVFEANNYIGGHTNTILVNDNGKDIPVDTGFIVFNEHNYPNLCRLFESLGVASRDSDMSFSVCCEKTGLEYNGTDLNRVFSQRKNLFNPKFLIMLKDILRFHKHAPGVLHGGLDDITTVAEFARQNAYSESFVENYLVPLGASLWSCPADRFRQFPIRFVLEFLDNHCMLQVDNRPQWKTVVGGSYQYIEPLTNGFRDKIYLNKAVSAVTRNNGKVDVHFSDNNVETFDEIILATHANTSRRLVRNIQGDELAFLELFDYQANEAVLHTDTSILPTKQRTWASWNYRIPAEESQHASVTYNMNMLQGIESDKTYSVSLNQTRMIDPEKIIKRILYHHPVFKPGRNTAQSQHHLMIRKEGISYCGAYWGFGFHEDGVKSALSVCDAFNAESIAA
ncbi:MAG: NAD(P)/FAD-dependent oxidoreductase [Gammaproteobacteria bacterium]|jgi:predicted NAD/FAD-binding protein